MHNIVYNGRDPIDAATFTKVYIYDYKKEKYESSLYKKNANTSRHTAAFDKSK